MIHPIEMCLFSQSVRSVSQTKILARALASSQRQLLVYSMRLDADQDLAMVLPIPVPPGSAEDAVRFVNMQDCPSFFTYVDALFPQEQELTRSFGFQPQSLGAAPKLVVHDVGDFEASFVPSRGDFDRLDERFRLAPEVMKKLPYEDWGFCVFKLKGVPDDRGMLEKFKDSVFGPPPRWPKTYHPMAFEFPRRDSRVFFPTMHVHDGEVHPTAGFDHVLYVQQPVEGWERSIQEPRSSGGMLERWLDGSAALSRKTMKGDLPNEDVFV